MFLSWVDDLILAGYTEQDIGNLKTTIQNTFEWMIEKNLSGF